MRFPRHANSQSGNRPPWALVARRRCWLGTFLLAWLGMLAIFLPAQTKPPAKPATSSAASKALNSKKQDEGTKWKTYVYKGRSYVAMESVAMFYGFGTPGQKGKSLWMTMSKPPIKFEATLGEKRVRLNNMVFYFSYPIIFARGKNLISAFDVSNVLDPILRPQSRRYPAQLRVVVLDAAGGGVEAGIRTSAGIEKELTLDLALRAKALIEQAGFSVVMVRDEDAAVFPLERIRLANMIKEEAVYLSLRANASTTATARGIECCTLPPASTPATFEPETDEVDKRFYPGNINDRESMALATTLQRSLIGTTKANDLGIKRVRFEELRGIEMPAVVCRVGFLTHKEEGRALGTDAYRNQLAKALAMGVQRYAEFLSTGLEERREADQKRPLYFGKSQVTHLDAAAGIKGERIIIRLPITAASGIEINRGKMELQLFMFEKVNGIDLDLTVANRPRIEWLSVLPDWKAVQTETVQAIFDRPPMGTMEMKTFGKRTYYGFVARLIYDGRLLDEVSSPENLNRCLYYFTPVFPPR